MATSTIVLDPGWAAQVTENGDISLRHAAEILPRAATSSARDPVTLEIFNNHFTHISTQMGLVLQRTALSVNVKERLLFFTASRAHHAEIGGVKSGSIYPFAKTLAEEGVLLRNFRAVHDGRFDEEGLMQLLMGGPYPSRCPKENVADIRAAIAANNMGKRLLDKMIGRYSWPVVEAYMRHIRDAAEAQARAAISRFEDGTYRFEDALDDGSPVIVHITIQGEQMTVDFTGSGPVNANSLNANRAVVQSAVFYCLRCLIDEDIPMNAGVLSPLQIILPGGMLNPPFEEDPAKCPAIVGGNVEVSQRLVDVIFGALGVVAASQGTMNNFVFGDDSFGYYETICGGTGAGPHFHGTSAVHSHMTNTRLTDVEILEKRYPVRLCRFQVRARSGGRGRFCGGDGVIREIAFLAPLDVSLLTQRRDKAPFGLNDAESASPGKNLLKRKGAEEAEQLPALAQFSVDSGDILTLFTPGGGGYGNVA